jgi:ribosomal protein S18 acetylase RimI-like enzyme
VRIIEIAECSEPVLRALRDLIPLLSSSAQPVTRTDLEELVRSDASHLFVAEEDGDYFGAVTLTVFRTPSGKKAWIDDLVVAKDVRGRGIGSRLLRKAVDMAEGFGATTIDLTSRPSRAAANALYKKAGFQQRNTNVYRYTK